MWSLYLHHLIFRGNNNTIKRIENSFIDYIDNNECGEIFNIEYNENELVLHLISAENNFKNILNTICKKK